VVFTVVWTPFSDRVTKGRRIRVSTGPAGIVEFVRSRLGFEPDARQIEVLESEAKQGILNFHLSRLVTAGVSGGGGESGGTAAGGVDEEGSGDGAWIVQWTAARGWG
jgi:hypothetical protein